MEEVAQDTSVNGKEITMGRNCSANRSQYHRAPGRKRLMIRSSFSYPGFELLFVIALT